MRGFQLDKLLQKLKKFREDRDWDKYHSPKNLTIALMVETAELAEHFQWLTQKQSKNLSLDKKEMIKDEIGDVMIYLVNLSDKLGIDPLQAAYDKIEKNIRKYPANKVRGKALKYSEYK